MATRSRYIIDGKLPCFKCKQDLPVSEFYVRSDSPTGFGYDCKDCNAEKSRVWGKKNADRLSGHWRTAQRNRKVMVLSHYSGASPKCACCGELHIEFLTIDHMDGLGAAHRRSIRKVNFYAWLIRNDFPDGFQVLCFNCNCAKRDTKLCPHQR